MNDRMQGYQSVHPEDIKAALRKKGYTLTAIASSLSVQPSAISHVLHKRRSRRIEKAIAKALGTRPNLLWPERYQGRA